MKTLLQNLLPPHVISHEEVLELDILGLKFKVAGLAVTLESGMEVFGSSSSTSESPLMHAGFECLERYVVMSKGLNAIEGEDFKYSLSNGVALHDSFEMASENAYLELVERNEILKSWYMNTPIKRVELDQSNWGDDFLKNYDLLSFDFSTLPGLSVIGMFAFPKVEGLNLIYGFGAGRLRVNAMRKAEKEFISCLGFLWDEKPSGENVPMKSPSFHQEFYLRPENHSHIKEWLLCNIYPKKSTELYSIKDVNFSNITPVEWNKELCVVKAEALDCIPLFFGKLPANNFSFTHRRDIPHPIA